MEQNLARTNGSFSLIEQSSAGKSSDEIRGLSVVYRRIESLKPHPNNARTHSRSQIRKLRDSIEAFGFVNPVLINFEGVIIAGHGRVEGAKLLGLKEVPTICLERLTPDQIRVYVIADNRLAESAQWNEQILRSNFSILSPFRTSTFHSPDLRCPRSI